MRGRRGDRLKNVTLVQMKVMKVMKRRKGWNIDE